VSSEFSTNWYYLMYALETLPLDRIEKISCLLFSTNYESLQAYGKKLFDYQFIKSEDGIFSRALLTDLESLIRHQIIGFTSGLEYKTTTFGKKILKSALHDFSQLEDILCTLREIDFTARVKDFVLVRYAKEGNSVDI